MEELGLVSVVVLADAFVNVWHLHCSHMAPRLTRLSSYQRLPQCFLGSFWYRLVSLWMVLLHLVLLFESMKRVPGGSLEG